MAQIDLSPVQVLTIAAGAVFSPAVAEVVGPYVVILLGAIGGAAVSLMNNESRGRGRAVMIFTGSITIAVLLTVPLALIISGYLPTVRDQWLFAPMALVLGFLGDKWSRVLAWMGKKANAFIDILIATRGKANE